MMPFSGGSALRHVTAKKCAVLIPLFLYVSPEQILSQHHVLMPNVLLR